MDTSLAREKDLRIDLSKKTEAFDIINKRKQLVVSSIRQTLEKFVESSQDGHISVLPDWEGGRYLGIINDKT